MQILIRDGGHTDQTLAALWQQLLAERLTGMTILGRHLIESAQLREGIELDEVRDVLWTYTAVELTTSSSSSEVDPWIATPTGSGRR